MYQESQNSYQPTYYYATSTSTGKAPSLVRLIFWVFYLTSGWSISFTFALIYLVLAFILPFSLPYALFLRYLPELSEKLGYTSEFLSYGDSLYFMVYSFATMLGVVMLLSLKRVGRSFLNIHKRMFRYFGGMDIR